MADTTSASVTGAEVTKDGALMVTIQDNTTGTQTPIFAGKIDVSEVVEEELQNYAPISAAIRPTVVGNPAVCENSVAWGLQGLKIYGKSTQDGTPSPENPVPIVSAGDGGALNVGLTGNQLFDANKIPTITKSGVTITNNGDGSFTISGSGETTDAVSVQYYVGTANFLRKGTLNLQYSVTINPVLQIVGCREKGNVSERTFTISKGTQTEITDEILNETQDICYLIYSQSGKTIQPGTIKPMLYQDGDGTWEPYHPPQQLTISTPNGLPGIPVESGGNFTDADGKQWICDIKDYGNRKYLQKYKKVVFNGSANEGWFLNGQNDYGIYAFGINLPGMSGASLENNWAMCDKLPAQRVGLPLVTTEGFALSGGSFFARLRQDRATSIDELRNWLSKNPITVLYPLSNPVETDIPEEELAAYRALTSYDGTTVISTAEPVAGIEARYILDGTAAWNSIKTIPARIAALEAAQTGI